MSRITPLSRDAASKEMLAYYDRVFGEGRDPATEPGTSTGTPGDWWTTWARAPDILNFFHSYTYTIVQQPIRSLALMRTGYVCQSHFVFSQHCKAARMGGLSEEKIEAVPYWQISDLFAPNERALLAYCDAYALQHGRIHDKVFAAMMEHFGQEQTLQLTYFINLYVLHSQTGRALRMEYDNVPERVVEIPAPATPSMQKWR
jgi:alkylhydroperoxidase family enzyme